MENREYYFFVKFETISWINKNEDWTNHKISCTTQKKMYVYRISQKYKLKIKNNSNIKNDDTVHDQIIFCTRGNKHFLEKFSEKSWK